MAPYRPPGNLAPSASPAGGVGAGSGRRGGGDHPQRRAAPPRPRPRRARRASRLAALARFSGREEAPRPAGNFFRILLGVRLAAVRAPSDKEGGGGWRAQTGGRREGLLPPRSPPRPSGER